MRKWILAKVKVTFGSGPPASANADMPMTPLQPGRLHSVEREHKLAYTLIVGPIC